MKMNLLIRIGLIFLLISLFVSIVIIQKPISYVLLNGMLFNNYAKNKFSSLISFIIIFAFFILIFIGYLIAALTGGKP
ncbi:hypothetical protein ABET41_05005 [Metabacillus fastidiosus]|uniref:Uncharacterized protein n=1 Tax=Metabacillus fastidiosus TaxID=1458 RepID=A0ABU6P3J4_9BACI|nr:hypothetical protein [Metabacillus fastidiosus]MED4403488.1 hypothetical protein [Metabacillus fastidiosus]MED4461060.1 hypothetical protein [Metabacillus fastidiosus]